MKRTVIIAEAGVNHNGSMELAREMVRVARDAGADYVKFQTALPHLVISEFAPKAEYQKETTGTEQSQLEMCRSIHLPLSAYAELAELCRHEGIGFVSTPFDAPSMDCLRPLGMDFWKIPSGEVTNLPYLRRIASFGEPVILSTGMSTIDEVARAVEILCDNGLSRDLISLLHCNTQYPTPMADVNLKAMEALRTLGCHAVGYSDHTVGIEVPIAAVALGADIIEKHFTLDKAMAGPDHKASLDPTELRAMVSAIRNVELALGGSGAKVVSASERPNIDIARRSIVASRHIRQGELLTPDNLEVKRPGTGLSPMLWDTVVGTRAIRDFLPDELITLE